MQLTDLLGLPSLEQFLDRYYLQVPIAVPGGCAPHRAKYAWHAIRDALDHPNADVLITRNGSPIPAAASRDIRACLDDGCSIRLRHAERASAPIAELASAFHAEFCCPVDCHVYFTGPSSVGLPWHYDAEEVFILQIEGGKRWRLRKNTVNPWPLIETLPTDQQLERERTAEMTCDLGPGDWLYIPGGYWHETRATEKSLSLSIGLLPATAVDVFDFLRSELLLDLRWRQRLPSRGEAPGASPAALTEYVLKDLTRDLHARLSDPRLVTRMLAARSAASAPRMPITVPSAPE